MSAPVAADAADIGGPTSAGEGGAAGSCGRDRQGAGYRFDVHPGLAEETVLLAIECASRELNRQFREERDALYEIRLEDERELGFERLNRRWWQRLELAEPLRRALRREPTIALRTRRCVVLPPPGRKGEFADLHQGSAGPERAPDLALYLRAHTLAHPPLVAALLARELIFIGDLLDPAFGFDRRFEDTDRRSQALIVERYRVLWETTVDGRLAAEGGPVDVATCRRRFARAFSTLGEGADGAFELFFEKGRCEHRELLHFARDAGGARSAGCSLCHLPCSQPVRGERLSAGVVAAIGRDYPRWSRRSAVCPQCADLYRARATVGEEPPSPRRHGQGRDD